MDHSTDMIYRPSTKKSGIGAKDMEGITFIWWKWGTEQLGKGKGMSDPLNYFL